MEAVKHYSQATLALLWKLTVMAAARTWASSKAFARFSWRATRASARTAWGLSCWAGRVTLWAVFFPLGMFRSYRHGKRRDQRELIAALQQGR